MKQARHPRAHARQPLARTVHQVGNVMVFEKRPREITVSSTLQLVEFRNEKQRVYGALVEHRLRRENGRLQDRAQARRSGELRRRARRHRDPVLKKVFLDYDQKALDDQYEQRVWVPHAEEIIRRYRRRQAMRVRTQDRRAPDRALRPRAPETLDIYGSGKKAFVFVHGGAWKRQSSREQRLPPKPIVLAGAAYVALDFALLPSVTLPEMAAQVCRGIEWVRQQSFERRRRCAATLPAGTWPRAH